MKTVQATILWDEWEKGWFVRIEKGDGSVVDSIPPEVALWDGETNLDDDDLLPLAYAALAWEGVNSKHVKIRIQGSNKEYEIYSGRVQK
jgi:hypothetical protein